MSPPSSDALFRYQVVSQVIARIYAAERPVDVVATTAHQLLHGSMSHVLARLVFTG